MARISLYINGNRVDYDQDQQPGWNSISNHVDFFNEVNGKLQEEGYNLSFRSSEVTGNWNNPTRVSVRYTVGAGIESLGMYWRARTTDDWWGADDDHNYVQAQDIFIDFLNPKNSKEGEPGTVEIPADWIRNDLYDQIDNSKVLDRHTLIQFELTESSTSENPTIIPIVFDSTMRKLGNSDMYSRYMCFTVSEPMPVKLVVNNQIGEDSGFHSIFKFNRYDDDELKSRLDNQATLTTDLENDYVNVEGALVDSQVARAQIMLQPNVKYFLGISSNYLGPAQVEGMRLPFSEVISIHDLTMNDGWTWYTISINGHESLDWQTGQTYSKSSYLRLGASSEEYMLRLRFNPGIDENSLYILESDSEDFDVGAAFQHYASTATNLDSSYPSYKVRIKPNKHYVLFISKLPDAEDSYVDNVILFSRVPDPYSSFILRNSGPTPGEFSNIVLGEDPNPITIGIGQDHVTSSMLSEPWREMIDLGEPDNEKVFNIKLTVDHESIYKVQATHLQPELLVQSPPPYVHPTPIPEFNPIETLPYSVSIYDFEEYINYIYAPFDVAKPDPIFTMSHDRSTSPEVHILETPTLPVGTYHMEIRGTDRTPYPPNTSYGSDNDYSQWYVINGSVKIWNNSVDVENITVDTTNDQTIRITVTPTGVSRI